MFQIGISKREDGARIAVASFSADPVKEFNDNNGFHTFPPKTVAIVNGLLDELKYSSKYSSLYSIN
jgi:hypothetical protein